MRPFPLLWHYTSLSAADGIIRNRAVRMTPVSELKDSQEHSLLLDEETLSEVPDLADLAEEAASGGWPIGRKAGALTACFSEAEDLYSQWAAYGDSAGGVALCFRGLQCNAASQVTGSSIAGYYEQFRQVEYCGPENYVAIAHDLVASIRSWLVRAGAKKDPSGLSRAQIIALAINNRLAVLKHRSFCDEREWRAIRVYEDWTPLTTGIAGSRLVEFAEYPLPMDLSSLSRVVVGPRSGVDPASLREYWGLDSSFDFAKSDCPVV